MSPTAAEFLSASKADVCEKCGGSGHIIEEKAPGQMGARRCECLEKRIDIQRATRAEIPARFAGKTLESFDARRDAAVLTRTLVSANAYAQEFPLLGDRPGLLLVGPPGCGKTHLAVGILKSVLAKGHDGLYSNYLSLLDRIREGWRQDIGTASIDAYQSVMSDGLVVIDDIGAHRGVDWVIDVVTSIIQHRYNANLPLIVTTNLPLAERPSDQQFPSGAFRPMPTLTEMIGQRSVSRLHEMCRIVELWGAEDQRRKP